MTSHHFPWLATLQFDQVFALRVDASIFMPPWVILIHFTALLSVHKRRILGRVFADLRHRG